MVSGWTFIFEKEKKKSTQAPTTRTVTLKSTTKEHLTVSAERNLVPALPGGGSGSSNGLVEPVSLSKRSGLSSSRGETPHFSVLVDGVDDPVNAGIISDDLVGRIDKNDLVVFVGGILINKKNNKKKKKLKK
jgi:hypothetical protein